MIRLHQWWQRFCQRRAAVWLYRAERARERIAIKLGRRGDRWQQPNDENRLDN
jgi:hypothetical protein